MVGAVPARSEQPTFAAARAEAAPPSACAAPTRAEKCARRATEAASSKTRADARA